MFTHIKAFDFQAVKQNVNLFISYYFISVFCRKVVCLQCLLLTWLKVSK